MLPRAELVGTAVHGTLATTDEIKHAEKARCWPGHRARRRRL